MDTTIRPTWDKHHKDYVRALVRRSRAGRLHLDELRAALAVYEAFEVYEGCAILFKELKRRKDAARRRYLAAARKRASGAIENGPGRE